MISLSLKKKHPAKIYDSRKNCILLHEVLPYNIREKLSLLINTPNLDLPEKQRILKALVLYAELNMDFIDAYNAHFAKDQRVSAILTYDKKHFDRLDWVERREP